MKPVLGSSLQGKKVVSQNGLDLGHVIDAHFENTGELISLIVRPERETKDIVEYIDRNHLLSVPYKDVKAIGRYVVVEFPFSTE